MRITMSRRFVFTAVMAAVFAASFFVGATRASAGDFDPTPPLSALYYDCLQ